MFTIANPKNTCETEFSQIYGHAPSIIQNALVYKRQRGGGGANEPSPLSHTN